MIEKYGAIKMLITGEIEPGIRIGNFQIGAMKEKLLSDIKDKYSVWERT